MRFRWPEDTTFTRVVLDVEQDCCDRCGRDLHICDHRIRHVYTLEHPLELCCRLTHCSDPACPSRPRTLSPAAELALALPGWLIGWDVLCFIGHRRFARHWPVPQIRSELRDRFAIRLSPDSISNYVRHYQNMLAARQQDFANLQRAYQDIDSVDLTIDGLQPEKGHETLYAVRELRAKRVWFAEALLCSTEAEVRRLLVRAGEMAKQLGKPIRLWMSDKQDAFVKGIAAEFPSVPHLYCGNHFLRGLAKPTLEADSAAKVKMRKKVRGLREVEREVLDQRRDRAAAEQSHGVTQGKPKQEDAPAASPAAALAAADCPATADAGVPARAAEVGEQEVASGPLPQAGVGGLATHTHEGAEQTGAGNEAAAGVVLDYCTAVRGILNDDQGGPLQPPGLRMAEALSEVRESLQRNLGLEQARASAWATGAVGRVHRPGAGGGESRAARSERASEGDPASGGNVGGGVGDVGAAEREVRAVARGVSGEGEEGGGALRGVGQGDAGVGGRTVREGGVEGGGERAGGQSETWRGGSAIPRDTRGESTCPSTRGYGSCRKGRRSCWRWMPIWSTTARSPPRNCCPTGTPSHPKISRKPCSAARSCGRLAQKKTASLDQRVRRAV